MRITFLLVFFLTMFLSGSAQKRSIFIKAVKADSNEEVENYFIQVNNAKGDSVASYHPLTHFEFEIVLPDTATYTIHAWKKGFLRFVTSTKPVKENNITGKETLTVSFKTIGDVSFGTVEFTGSTAQLSPGQQKQVERAGEIFFRVQHQSRLEITFFDAPGEKGQMHSLRCMKITEILKDQGCDIHKIIFVKGTSPKQPVNAFAPKAKTKNAYATFKILSL